jgi:hypothetical protein
MNVEILFSTSLAQHLYLEEWIFWPILIQVRTFLFSERLDILFIGPNVL